MREGLENDRVKGEKPIFIIQKLRYCTHQNDSFMVAQPTMAHLLAHRLVHRLALVNFMNSPYFSGESH